MDKKILVEEKINNGKNFLENLKNKHIKINDALWVYDEEHGYWKLIITSPIVKKEGPLHFYKIIDKIIKKNALQYDNISVKSPDDNMIKMLKSAYGVRNKIYHNIPLNDTYIYFMGN